MSRCAVDGCERAVEVKVRGWCGMHYQRWNKYGDPLALFTIHARNLEDVWVNIVRGEPDECWLWTGPLNKDGYGDMRVRGVRGAHRIVFVVTTGIDPSGGLVCHTCDNPPCCNPSHLFLGTHTDNVRDMHSKGRWVDRRGSRHPLAKLSESQVREIRARWAVGETGRSLAHAFGVSESRVSSLVRHPERYWSHA